MEDTSVTGRVTTGIAGLDAILMGGLLNGSTVIAQGPPGSGKTILANQLAFHRACQGELVVYVTLVAESHTRLLRHLRTLTFFEPSLVGDRILYLSGYHALRESATALLALLQKELVVRRPGLLVVDGISAIQETHGVPAARQFLHELQASTESANCTALLVSATQTSPTPEDAVVDAAIFLAEHQVGVRPIREIQVHKTRGSSHLAGRHTFIIDARGLVVFPRIEALYRMPSQAPSEGETRVGFGRTGLDAMVGGGLRSGSSTLVLGATGTGKTLLGLTFLAAGLSDNETVIYSGFYETPDRLLASGDGIGLRLRDQAAAGRLHLEWRPPVELFIDAWADRLLERVRTTRPRRLFIDGLNAILEGATRPERLSAFLTALANELRAHEVTTLISGEMHPIVGKNVDVPLPGVSPIVENTILLRYVEDGTHLSRQIAVLKIRDSEHDSLIRTFSIAGDGIVVGPARTAKPAAPRSRPRRRRRP